MKKLITLAAAFALALITGSAIADTDENGLTPKHWYKFNGNLNSSGETAVSIGGESAASYFAGIDGQAYRVVDGSAHPYGSGVQYGNGAWSIVTVAKATFKNSNATIFWATGTKGDWFGLLAPNGGTSVMVASGNANGITDYTLSASGFDAKEYHVYVIVYNGNGGLSLYVDGELGAMKTGYTPKTNGNFQWGAVQQGMPQGTARVTGTGLDDWRLYQQALTADQIKAIYNTFKLATPRVVAINFRHADDQNVGENDNSGVPGIALKGKGWTGWTGATGTDKTAQIYDTAANQFEEANPLTITYSSANTHYYNDANSPILKGYLDDGQNDAGSVQISASVPFNTYDLILICTTDAGASATYYSFCVNGNYYYADAEGVTHKGDVNTTWGAGNQTDMVMGKNVIRINGLSGDFTLKGNYRHGSVRGSVAGLVFVESLITYSELTATVSGEQDFDTIPWEGDKTADVITYRLTLDGPTTLILGSQVDGSAYSIEGGNNALTIKNAQNLTSAFATSGVSETVYEYNCISGFTASSALLTTIKNGGNNDKFVFIGEGDQGASLGFGDPGKTLSTHIVFKGGTHSLRVTNGNRLFATSATGDNPTVLVTDNAIVNFTAKDVSGWSGGRDVTGIIRVNEGAKINLIQDGSNTFFYRQRLWIDPGAEVTFNYGMKGTESAFRWQGGAVAGEEQIYVPASENDQTGNPAILRKLGSGPFHLASDNTRGVAVFVGKNSKLVFDTPITTGASNAEFKKTGAGKLEITGDVSVGENAFIVDGGELTLKGSIASLTMNGGAILDLSGRTDTTTALATGTVTMNAATSIRFPEGFTEDSTIVLTSGTLDAPLAARGIPVYVGASDTPIEGAVIKYDATNKTVAYSVATVVNVEIPGKSAVSIAEIEEAVALQESGWTGDVKITLDEGAELTVEKELVFNSIQVICAGDIILSANCETAVSDLAKFSLVGVEGLISVKFADGITVDDETVNGLKNIGSGAGIRFIFTDGFVPTTAPAAGVIYRWEGTTALAMIPYALTPHAGKIELACPVTAFSTDAGIFKGNKTVVFDAGFSIDTDERWALGNEGGVTQNIIQKGGDIVLTHDGDGSERAVTPFLLSHWSSTVNYAMTGGSITANNGTMTFGWDGTATLTIGGGANEAVFAIKGINGSVRNNSATLTLAENGVLKVGDAGVRLNTNKSLDFAGGTYVATETHTVQNGTISLTADAAIDVANEKTLTISSAITGTGKVIKTGEGTLVLNNFTAGQANTFIADGGTLIPSGNTFDNIFVANAGGTVKFAVDMSESTEVVVPYQPQFGASEGTLKYELTLNADQIKKQTAFTVLTLPEGMEKDDITFAIINADTGNEVNTVVTLSANEIIVYANVVVTTHEFTPSESGAFTWKAGESFGESVFRDYDNATFNSSEYTTEVTVGGARLEAGEVKVGGVYTFAGAPTIVDSITTLENANATFNNDLVAGEVAVTSGVVNAKSLVASEVLVSNATINAQMVGPSMKYVRLSISATHTDGNVPAVGEFRLYRGNATTGYTIVDWPIGTKVSESTGKPATKETDAYPSEVGRGLGNVGGNECQPGCLIDGYYGNVGTPKIYGNGAYNTPAYNKWWPTSQAAGPWVVTIEFPYPVATFSGCNFCLADHQPRNPTAWTIEVSSDGINWTTVNETTGAEWSGQYAWAAADDKPDNVEAENWPAFLNGDTTPTAVTVGGDATIVADGSWTVDLKISGNLTLKGVPNKHLTLDGASTTSFADDAKLTFDLSAYAVTSASKQYVIAGPLDYWPAVEDIAVLPEGRFVLDKDEGGYFVTVRNGSYWIGEDEEGTGTWDVGNIAAWGETIDATVPYIWLNDVEANFARNGVVTLTEGIKPTAVNFVADYAAVEFNGPLAALDEVPVVFNGVDCTFTINNGEAYTPGEITENDSAKATIVKKGEGALTLTQDLEISNFKLEGGKVEGEGMLIVGGTISGAGIVPNLWLGDGATADMTGLTVSNLVFESSVTLVLSQEPTKDAPVKIIDGEFEEEISFYGTVVAVKVGETTLPGDFLVIQKTDGWYVTVNPARRWTGLAGDNTWNNPENWASGVPVAGDTVVLSVNGDQTLILPETGVGALSEIIITGEGKIYLDAAKFAEVGKITIEDTVSVEATANEDVVLALDAYGDIVKKGTGKLTINANNFTAVTVEEGTLSFNVAEGEEKTISSVISGDGAVAKTGLGTLTLMPVNTYTGGTIVEAGTLKFGGTTNQESKGPIGPYGPVNSTTVWPTNAIVKAGAVLDLNGAKDLTYGFVLEENATFKNGSTTGIGDNSRQTKYLVLDGDATVDATGAFGIHNGSNVLTKLDLGTNTLTKVGSGIFDLVNTSILGSGTINVKAGTLRTNTSGSVGEEATVNLDGGSLKLDANLTVKNLTGEGQVTGGSRLTVNGMFDSTVDATNLTLGEGATIRLTDAGDNLSFKSGWTLNGNVYVDFTDEVLTANAKVVRQGLEPVMVSWMDMGDAFDPSIIKIANSLKQRMKAENVKLVLDIENKCLRLALTRGFMIMVK